MKSRLKFLATFTAILFCSLLLYPIAFVCVFIAPKKLKKALDRIYVFFVLFNWLQKSKNEI